MTSSIPSRFRRRSGFTLVEMLVVIGIMLLLMAILLPGINRAYKVAVRARMEADLQVISSALEAYRADFDLYPQIIKAGYGADTLFTALIGPNATGFQARPGGKRWGPYLPADRFKTDGSHILDRYKHPVFYFPAKHGPGINIYNPGGYLGPNGMFNPDDNSAYTGNLPYTSDPSTAYWPPKQLNVLLGDLDLDGMIGPGETPAFTGNYIVWSCGPDEHCGPALTPTTPVSPRSRCDDVANFPRREF